MKSLAIRIVLISISIGFAQTPYWEPAQTLPAVPKDDNSGDLFGYRTAVFGDYAAIAALKNHFDTGAV